MPPVPVPDRLLMGLFGMARRLFLLQGLAFGCACVAALAWGAPAGAADWVSRTLFFAGVLSGTFVAAGLLLGWMRQWRPPEGTPHQGSWPWSMALGSSLVVAAGLAAIAAAGLPSLWRQIAEQLAAIGFWEGIARPDPFGGIVILPILVTLFVPALVTSAAAFSFGLPLVLLARLSARPLLFPTLLAMGAVCQAALVGTGWLASSLLGEVAQAAIASMSATPDPELAQVAGQLNAAIGTLTRAATALVLPLACMISWAVFLRPSGPPAASFSRDATAEPVGVPSMPATIGVTPVVHRVVEEPTAARIPDSPAPIAAALPQDRDVNRPGAFSSYAHRWLTVLGVLLLLFWAVAGLRARPAYVNSMPAVGSSLDQGPAVIQVTFTTALDSASTLSLVQVPAVPGNGEIAREIPILSRLAADDPQHRTIEGIPPGLGQGLYLVRWAALPAGGGGVSRHGSFSFGVGAAVPEDGAGNTYSLYERDDGARGHRSTFLGGLVLLVLGVLARARREVDIRSARP
jgi:methionine-rich copper-binding protein CopC